jgi:hypothetical protein
MSESLHVEIEDHGLQKKLDNHADRIGPELTRRVNRMLVMVENNVKFVTHRGQHCKGKGGDTKASIKHRMNSNGGMVYVDEGHAPWAKWYIDGRGPVEPKQAKVLRFCVDNEVIFARRVKAWKGHDILKEGLNRSLNDLESQTKSLGNWLVEL